MFSKLKKPNSEGFTIIEVIIVLAIAALILLIVLLAVPALQRNSRNTQRKNDVSALLGGFSNYLSNNNGTIPASCDYTDAGPPPCWMKDTKLGYYDGTTAGNVTWTKQAAATAPGNVADPEHVALYNYAKCATSSATTVAGTKTTTTTGASSRTAVALYAVEGSGSTTYICQDL
ncbi:MAG TPA: prepilin-type N-terminal cleavage/methylation domain-containing protein [Verrucomicrobiae bacterium]|nr:prepilin-type N-terminal cleavage/methylation domain-containing protein [Verrucomicrobiae bacterium]